MGILTDKAAVDVAQAEQVDPISELFELASPEFDVGDIETFREDIRRPEAQRELYDLLSPNYELGSFDEYSAVIKPHLPKTATEKAIDFGVQAFQQAREFFSPGDDDFANLETVEARDMAQKAITSADPAASFELQKAKGTFDKLGIIGKQFLKAASGDVRAGAFLTEVFDGLTGDQIANNIDKSFLPLRERMPEDTPENFLEGSGANETTKDVVYGMGKGLASIAEGFVTPRNAAIIAGAGIATAAFPPLGAAIGMFFMADIARHLPELGMGFVDAMKRGDVDEATELATITLAHTGFAALLGKESIKRIKTGEARPAPDVRQQVEAINKALKDPEIAQKVADGVAEYTKLTEDLARQRDFEQRIRRMEETPKTSYKEIEILETKVTERQTPIIETAPDPRLIRTEPIIEAEGVRIPRPEDITAVRGAGSRVPSEAGLVGPSGQPLSITGDPLLQPSKIITQPGRRRLVGRDAVVKERGKPIREMLEELREVGDDVRREANLKKYEKQAKQTPKIEIVDGAAEAKLAQGLEKRALPAEGLKNLRESIDFLERYYPNLMRGVDQVKAHTAQSFASLFPDDMSSNGAFIRYKNAAGETIGREIHIKLENVRQPIVLEKSPQIEGQISVERAMQRAAELEPVASVRTLVSTVSHEFRHNRDFMRFGDKDFDAMSEIGSRFVKGKKGEKIPVDPDVLTERTTRIEERGLRPQRYLAQLRERRARAQSRAAIRLFDERMKNNVDAAFESFEIDPAARRKGAPDITDTRYKAVRPHLEAAWEAYRLDGRGFNEFKLEMTKQFGEQIGPYIDRFEGQHSAQGMTTFDNPNERGKIEPPESQSPHLPEQAPKPADVKPSERIKHWEDIARSGEGHARTWNQKLADLFSVEARYGRISDLFPGAQKVGVAVKNFFGIESGLQDRGVKVARDIANSLTKRRLSLKPDLEAAAEMTLFAESAGRRSRMTQAQLEMHGPGLKMYDNFVDFIKRSYADNGGALNLKGRMLQLVRGEIARRRNVGEPRGDFIAALERAQRIETVDSIPAAMWLESQMKMDARRIPLIFEALEASGKKSININSLMDSGLLKPNDINILDVTAQLGRRAGQDISVLNVRKAAVEAGMAKRLAKDEQVSITDPLTPAPEGAKFFAGYKVHPLLKDWLNEMTGPRRGINVIDTGISAIKMAAFWNPLFLPMYDIVQSGLAGALKPHMVGAGAGFTVGGIPGAAVGAIAGEALSGFTLVRGMGHAIRKTDLYYQAVHDGLSSTPFPNPFESFRDSVRMTKRTRLGQAGELLTDLPGFRAAKKLAAGERGLKVLEGFLPNQTIRNMYNLSWGMAWQLDRGVRMGTYMWLRKKGFESLDAAQIAARYHGDYASVPTQTRKMLNRFFFTPTFKIAMAKLQGEMVTSAIKASGRLPADLGRRLIGKEAKGLTKRESQFMSGMLMTGTILVATDMFMRANGFEAEEWGVKYKRPTLTDEGPKDLVVSISNPANLFIKYYNRVKSAFGSDVTPAGKALFNRFTWEFTPVFRVGLDVLNNRDSAGDHIYSPFDTDLNKVAKATKYTMLNTYQILGFLDPEAEQAEIREKLAEDVGQVFQIATRPFTFRYLKSPDMQKGMIQIQKAVGTYQRLLRDGQIPPEEAAAQMQNLLERINDIMEDNVEPRR